MQTIVGVLRGGPSREHEVSLKTGAAMLANLPEERFVARDIYINKNGAWHDRGKPVSPERVLRQVDVVLNGLHGITDLARRNLADISLIFHMDAALKIKTQVDFKLIYGIIKRRYHRDRSRIGNQAGENGQHDN